MAVFVLRPVAGAETVGPRIETLVPDPEDVELGVAERFLEAREVPVRVTRAEGSWHAATI